MPESRAAYVQGLENELAYLEHQPVPNTRRLADVRAQLKKFSSTPDKGELETAAAPAPDPEAEPKAPTVHAVKRAPAKKAAAKRTAKKV